MSVMAPEETRNWRIESTELGDRLVYSKLCEWDDEEGVDSEWIDHALMFIPSEGWLRFIVSDHLDRPESLPVHEVIAMVPVEFVRWVAAQENARQRP